MSTWHPDLLDPNEDATGLHGARPEKWVATMGLMRLQTPVFELVRVNRKKHLF